MIYYQLSNLEGQVSHVHARLLIISYTKDDCHDVFYQAGRYFWLTYSKSMVLEIYILQTIYKKNSLG